MTIATYAGVTATFTPAASATDIFNISGSSTKTIRVLTLILSGTQTTGGNVSNFSLIKRSTADTGGTAVATTKVPLDSGYAAATATVQHYTANPTTGSSVGTIWSPRVLVPAPASVIAPAHILYYDPGISQWLPVPVLRGTAEQLCVNMGGTVPTGAANFTVTVVWSEE